MDSRQERPAPGAPSTWGQALVLVGLAGLAITQPVLDLMGRNPEFFVAGRYTSSQIVAFALVVALVPSAVLVAAFVTARVVHARAGRVVHGALVAGLGALFGNVLVRGLGFDGAALALVATLLGAGMALVLARARSGGLLLRYLAAANVLFLLAFLLTSPASALLSGGVGADALGTVSVPVPPGPVVVIIFDELPLPTLMRTDGTINAERYPSFARLAAGATWFRNASSPHNRTERAVPAIVTGTVLEERTMPTFNALPRNLLALLSTAMPIARYEPVTDLCPREACEERDGQPLRQALEDSMVVFGHRVLPPGLRNDLAPIDDAWGSFGDVVGGGATDTTVPAPTEDDPLARWHTSDRSERSPSTQARRLVEHGLAIDGTPALHFIHVVVPHAPWFITPWATRLLPPMPPWRDDEGQEGPVAAWSSLIRYQRHSLQTGAADVALGQVLDHLEASGTWDDATVIVAADHGTSTIPPDVTRTATENNEEEVYRVPIFVKAAGQRSGEVVDDVAMTTDILPTLIDLLEIETDWQMDGHSLLDGSDRRIEPLVSTDVDALLGVVRRHAADFPHGWDWSALAAVGDHGALVGRPLAELDVGGPSALRWAPANEAAFGAVPDADGRAPQVVTGTVTTPGGAEPPALVIAINGTVAGVTGGYERQGAGWSFSSMLGPYLQRGANQIVAYEVTEDAGRTLLHLVG